MKGSSADPNRIYVSQTSGWFGQIIQRSDDGGKTWHQPGSPPGEPTTTPDGMPKGESNKFVYDTSPETGKPLTTHLWYDGTQHPWEFKRVWHLEPSLARSGHSLCRRRRRGDLSHHRRRQVVARAARVARPWHRDRSGSPAPAACACTPSSSTRPIRSASMSPFPPRAPSARTTAERRGNPLTADCSSPYLPEPTPEIGFCVHRLALHPSRPDVVFMQLHQGGGVFRSDNAGDQWVEVNGNLPTDFGFPIDVHAHEADTVYAVPMDPNLRVPPEGKLRVYRSRTGGNEWEPLTRGLPQENCYVNVLRDAMAVDKLDPCGIYFGTTGGQVYASPDGGDSWNTIVHDLPAVLSVEVQTLP